LLEVKTEDGLNFKLAAHRGQYVLLDFEPTYGAGVPELKQSVASLWASFGKNGRLAMLTLEVPWMGGDGGVFPLEAPPWPRTQLIYTPSYENKHLLLSFGLQCDHDIIADPNLPLVFLVGPDGKIVAKDLHGDAIKAAVAQALGPK
jgi:hypothetical protein